MLQGSFPFDSPLLLINCLAKQFAMCLGVVAILLLNVMEVFSMGGGAMLDRPCMVFTTNECACCARDPSVHLSIPSIGFVYVLYVGSYLLI